MKRSRALIVTGAVAIGLVCGVVGVIASGGLVREARNAGANVVAQSGSATSGGLTLAAQDAIFSGTETIVRVDVDGVNGARAHLAIEEGWLELTGFEAGASFMTRDADSGSTLLVLPPVMLEGEPSVTLTRLEVRSDEQRREVSGEWTMVLSPPTDRGAALRTEPLEATAVTASGITIMVEGLRSTSQTVVEYTTPSGVYELMPPRIRLGDGNWLAPIAVRGGGSSQESVALFAVTPFGSPLEVGFGPFSRPTDGDLTVLRLDLSGLEVGLPPARVPAPIGGDLLESAERFMDRRGREVVKVTVKGNWEIDAAYVSSGERIEPWDARTATGAVLRSAGASQHWTKNDSGEIGPGVTSLEMLVDAIDLSDVTITLGRAVSITTGDWRTKLTIGSE